MTKSSLRDASAKSGHPTRFLLIVDDDAGELFYLSMLLQRFEYSICTAKTLDEAENMCAVAVPALIIVDQALLGANTVNFMKRIMTGVSAEPPKIVVMMTGHSASGEKRWADAGAAGCVRKPVQAADLYRIVQAAIEQTPRRIIRIPTRLPVVLNKAAMNYGSGEYVSALSEEGMYIRTLNPMQKGSLVTVQFMVRDRMISSEAEVIYCSTFADDRSKQPGMGLHFKQISHQDKELIRSFVVGELTAGIRPI